MDIGITMTAPAIVFFNTFLVVVIVLLGLIVLLVLWWCMYGMCQRRSNASTQEILPTQEMKSTRESNLVVNQTVPDVVVTDMPDLPVVEEADEEANEAEFKTVADVHEDGLQDIEPVELLEPNDGSERTCQVRQNDGIEMRAGSKMDSTSKTGT